MLLALDTSTPLVTVALHDDGRVVDTATSEQPMKHGEQLAPMIAAALDRGRRRSGRTSPRSPSGSGPGPFTGLRVGLVTARTLGLALGIPVYGACSLDVLAVRAVDARASPSRSSPRSTPAARSCSGRRTTRRAGVSTGRTSTGPPSCPTCLVVGAGPVLYPDVLRADRRPGGARRRRRSALAVAEERLELLDPEPIYLRRPDATVPGPPKKVS